MKREIQYNKKYEKEENNYAKVISGFFKEYWIINWKYSWTNGNTEYFVERGNSVFHWGILFIFEKNWWS